MPQRRRLARAALSTTAAAACLALATPAWASSTIGLNPAHEGRTAAHFNQVCDDERFAGLPAGDDGWHFVLPGKEYGDFESLTLTFNDGTAAVTVTIPDGSDAYPDFFYSTGGRNPGRSTPTCSPRRGGRWSAGPPRSAGPAPSST